MENKSQSGAEEYLLRIWNSEFPDGPRLEPQFHFRAPGSKQRNPYRADFRVGPILIEVQGGEFVRGAHVRPGKYSKDCARLNAGTLAGFRWLWFTPLMLEQDPVGVCYQIHTAWKLAKVGG